MRRSNLFEVLMVIAVVPSTVFAGESGTAHAKMKLGDIRVSIPALDQEFSASNVIYDVEEERDAASGLPVGKRQHKPFTVTKPVDKATAMLLGALKDRTRLPEVSVEVFARGGGRDKGPLYSYTLIGAQVVSSKMISPISQPPTEEFALVFEKISIEITGGSTTYEDDWRAQQ